MVVDQGLATSEEIQLCFEQKKTKKTAPEDEKEKSLAELLVANDFVTQRQLDRMKTEIEASKKSPIPGYRMKRKLGAGAMAQVFLAKQISLDRYVAIKVLPKKFSTNANFIERFHQEGRAAAKLNHPNIVQAYDVGQIADTHYFVMEYVDGHTVYDAIAKHKRYPERDAIDIILQIADALQHAHDKKFVHRDVKPKNIMITKEGVAKLADMGLARAVTDKEAAEQEKGRAFGTPYYISPEQIRGEVDIDAQADIYSLGATFYHMVTGQVPFDGENPSAVMHKHLKAELVPPDHVNPNLSAGVSEIIEMMMSKKRNKRYHNCNDLITDLKAVKGGEAPPIAHAHIDMDLSGLRGGTLLSEPLDDTMVGAQALASPPENILNHPAFLLLLVLFVISVLGNVILIITNMA